MTAYTHTIVSPFCGGLSFEFHLQALLQAHTSRPVRILANDAFPPVIAFWQACKTQREALCEALDTLCARGVSKAQFKWHRADVCKRLGAEGNDAIDMTTDGNDIAVPIPTDDNLALAVHFFVLNRCSFSGATLSGGYSKESSTKRFTPSSVQRVRNLDLSHVSFTCLDYRTFWTEHVTPHLHGDNGMCSTQMYIKKNVSPVRYPGGKTRACKPLSQFLPTLDTIPRTLVFADPPYPLDDAPAQRKHRANALYGTNGNLHAHFDHIAHEGLRDRLVALHEQPVAWMATYNDCSFVRGMYEGEEATHGGGSVVEVHEAAWTYGMKQGKRVGELVVVGGGTMLRPDQHHVGGFTLDICTVTQPIR